MVTRGSPGSPLISVIVSGQDTAAQQPYDPALSLLKPHDVARRRERLLQHVFGQVEILDRADEARQDAPVFAPVQLAEVHHSDAGTTGRTSIEPPTRSVGMRPAIASASSKS